MPYLGQRPSKGDENNFKILDDISSYTLTFDGSDSSVVSAANDTITSLTHRFVHGQRVTYNKGGGTVIAGLSNGVYYIIKEDHNTIKLATSASNATNGIAVNITGVGGGSSHTLNVAFDGINTKFKATHTNGQKAKITRSAQLVISINGVIQQPHDSATPSTGFGFDLDGTIVLSQAPVAGDVYWAHVLTNNNVTFDISDNDVDNFTGNGSTVSFNLSKTPPDNRNILVTIDGVVQYPNDPDGTARAYTVVENVLTFTTAPDANVQIQVRHIGFAGSTSGSGSGGVTSFYGRTGAVVLKNTDNIVANNAEFAGNLTVNGTTTTLDTVLTEVDKLEVAANNTTVGVAITQSGSGDILNLYDGSSEVFSVVDGGITRIKKGVQLIAETSNLYATDGALSYYATNNAVYLNGAGNNGRLRLNATGSNNDRTSINLCGQSVSNAQDAIIFKTATNERFRINASGNIKVQDDVQLQFGGTAYNALSYDFQIYHSGLENHVGLTTHPLIISSTGGERLRITSAGLVGIGTDNPQQKLDVRGNGVFLNSGNDTSVSIGGTVGNNNAFFDLVGDATYTDYGLRLFRNDGGANTTSELKHRGTGALKLVAEDAGSIQFFTSGTAASNERLRINSSGKILIGDDTAEITMGLNANVQTFGTDASASSVAIRRGSNDAQAAFLVMSKSRNTSVGSRTILQNGDEVGNIFFVADDGTDLVSNTAAIKSQIDGVPGANDTPGNLTFWTTADGANSATEKLRIDSNGVICVNHTNALHSGKLQVSATGADAIDINSYSTNANSGGRLSFYRSKNASIGSNTIVTDDDSLGRIDFRGYNINGNSYDQGATIEARVDGSVNSSTDMPTAILFKTSGDGSANPDERLRITSAGAVGINTTNPENHLLEIYTPRSADWKFRIHTDVSDGAGFYQRANGDFEMVLRDASNNNNFISGNGGDLEFATSGTEKLRIDSNGRILIGHATTPTAALSVAVVGSYGASSTLTPFVYLCRDEDATSIGANESLGQILFASRDGYRGSVIEAKAGGTWSGSSSDGYLVFKTTPDNTTVPEERLRITSNGRVNIGTGNLNQTDRMLNVYGGRVRIEGISSGNSFEILNSASAGQSNGILCQAGTNSSDINATFRNTSGATLFRIRGDGKVIVGNNGTTFGNAAVQAFIQHGNTAGESGFSSVDTTSVAAGVGGEIAFHGKYNTGAQDYAYYGHIRGTKENATAGDTACALKFFTRPNATAPIERLRIDSTGSLFAGGTVITESDMNWIHDTYQRPHIFSGITGGNPSDGVVVVASPETNPSNTRVGAIVFGCKTSSTAGVSNSGLKAVIDCYTNTNTSDAWKTGAAMNFSVRRDNGNLENKFQITRDGVIVKRQDTGSEGGEVMLCRPSDDTPHFHIDAFGAAGTPGNTNDWVNNANPTMRIHTGGVEIFKIGTNGNIRLQHNPVFCGVYQNGSSVDANSNPTIFDDTVYINKGAGQSGSASPYNTGTGYFTCPSGGYYQVYVQAHLQSQSGGAYSTWRIYHNSTIVSNAWKTDGSGGSLVASVIVNASGGDTLHAAFVSTDTTQYTNETYWVLHILKVG